MRIFKITFAVVSFFLVNNLFGQLQVVNTGMSPQQFVQNVLIGGGITVSNVTYQGQIPEQIGRFQTGTNATNLGISTGIILSTGNVTTAPGPNNSTGGGGFNSSTGSDPDLQTIAGLTVYDKSVLEFDFTPISDTVKFEYVFASEEYPEFVNSGYNDVFGFFLSGPGISGPYSNNSVNIALIPGTTTPVTIDNVNTGLNAQYYVNNTGGTSIQYDGFTRRIKAWRVVQPCVQYHIKIAVGDAGDSNYDSAVFLEAGSFVSTGVSAHTAYNGPDTASAIRSCNSSAATVTFTIPQAVATPTVINYTVGGTAVNGVDYVSIPTFVTIPAGQTSANVIISPLPSTGNAPIETVILTASLNPCQSSTITVNIRDYPPLSVAMSPNTAVCAGSSTTINAVASGGFTPYSYLWSTGATTSSITVTPTVTTTYYVTVHDICSQASGGTMVTYNTIPTSIFTAPPVCGSVPPLTINTATVTYIGQPGAGATFAWTFSGPVHPYSASTLPGPHYLTYDDPTAITSYNISLTVTDPSGCTSTTTQQIQVIPSTSVTMGCCINPPVNAGANDSVCGPTYQLNGSVNPSTTGVWTLVTGTGPANFSPGATVANAFVTVPGYGPYTFQWTETSGSCDSSDVVIITFVQIPTADAGLDIPNVCGDTIRLAAIPSVGAGHWYDLDNLSVFTPVTSATALATCDPGFGLHNYMWIENNFGCRDTDYVDVTFHKQPQPDAGPDQIACGNTANLSGNPNTSVISGFWTGPAGVFYAPSDTTSTVNIIVPPYTVNPYNVTFWWHQVNEMCKDSDQVTIAFQPFSGQQMVSAGFDIVTCDTFAQLHGIVQPNGFGTGHWSTFDAVTMDNALTDSTFIRFQPNADTYRCDSSKYVVTMTWTVSNGTNCTASDNVKITFYQRPKANAGFTDNKLDWATCDMNMKLGAMPSICASYGSWSLASGPAGCTSPNFSYLGDPRTSVQVGCYGIYDLVWREQNTYNNQCTSTDTLRIEFVEPPNISAGSDQQVCGNIVYLHAIPSDSSAGRSWATAPVNWLDPNLVVDPTQIVNPSAIASHFHTENDCVDFVWTEYNVSTIPLQYNLQCPSHDTVKICFYTDYPANDLVSSTDTFNCGRRFPFLNAAPPPQGVGYWVDSTHAATTFTPPNNAFPANLHDTALVSDYGMHHFYWVVQNGVRPNGSSVCIDSSEVIPIRFIEMPNAMAADSSLLWMSNPNHASRIKWDTVCGPKYGLMPILNGTGTVQWQSANANIRFLTNNSTTSPVAFDSVLTPILNSDIVTPAYYEVYLSLDNSTLLSSPWTHGCTDKDTLRITFAAFPTAQIQIRTPYGPYCYGDVSPISAEDDLHGQPKFYEWDFSGGIIDTMTLNTNTTHNINDSVYYVSWDTTSRDTAHVVSLRTTNAWGCMSPQVTDTIYEPKAQYPLDSVIHATCLQSNGRIILYKNCLTCLYNWTDPQFQPPVNPLLLDRGNLESLVPYHITLSYKSWNPTYTCKYPFTITIRDTGAVDAILHITGDTLHLTPGDEVFFADSSKGGKTYEWHFGDGGMSTSQNPSHTYIKGGTFYVYLITRSKEGCEDRTDSVAVEIEKSSDLTVPNIFTPNGDGKNDIFQVTGKTLKSFHGMIVNRWGKTLYEWNDWEKEIAGYKKGWDGKIGNTEASPGVYYYVITAVGWDDVKYDLKGAVHLEKEK